MQRKKISSHFLIQLYTPWIWLSLNQTWQKRGSPKPSYYSACVPATMWRPDLPHAPLPLYASPVLTCCLIHPQSHSPHRNHWKSPHTLSENRPSFVTEAFVHREAADSGSSRAQTNTPSIQDRFPRLALSLPGTTTVYMPVSFFAQYQM